MGPAKHEDSPVNEDNGRTDKANTSIHADHHENILVPPSEDVSISLFPPAEEDHDHHSSIENAQQQNAGSCIESGISEVLMQATATHMPNVAEPATILEVDKALVVEEDAAHRMLLRAVTDLQVENASLTEALSLQSQELQSLR